MRYPNIRISFQDISRIAQGYLKDIFQGDIHRSPLISLFISFFVSFCLSMYIFLLIQRYLSSYPHYILGISFYLSFNILNISLDIFLLIPRSPAIYPAGCLLRFRLVRLAAACRLSIALRKLLCFISATPGAALSRPGDPAAGPAGARRRRVRMAGWGPLAEQPGPAQQQGRYGPGDGA